jgi:protein-S-isoprenylcysteine O-methyltransferase Ste14
MAQEAVLAVARPETMKDRIDSMFAQDRTWAMALVVGLWLTVFFVMFAIRGFIADPTIEIICWAAAALLLLFNTASIFAMFRHYAQDKDHIYSVDIKHLDAGR